MGISCLEEVRSSSCSLKKVRNKNYIVADTATTTPPIQPDDSLDSDASSEEDEVNPSWLVELKEVAVGLTSELNVLTPKNNQKKKRKSKKDAKRRRSRQNNTTGPARD